MADQGRLGLRWLHLSREVRSCLPRDLALAVLRYYKPFALRDVDSVEGAWRTRDKERYLAMVAQELGEEDVPVLGEACAG